MNPEKDRAAPEGGPHPWDRETLREEIGLARPSRDPDRIGRLLDGIMDRFDAGYGIDAVRAEAAQAEVDIALNEIASGKPK